MSGRIVVFGSFVVDLTTRQNGLPLPGQTVLGSSFRMGPGGKGSNQAVAAHRAGGQVSLVTKIGRDLFSDVALNFYRDEGMDTSHVLIDAEQATGTSLIMVDEQSSQNAIVVVPAACMHFTDQDVESCRSLIESARLLLLQLEINMDALEKAVDIAHAAGSTVVLNPAPANALSDELLSKVDILTPNETEAQALTGVEVKDVESARRAANVFLKKGVRAVVITMGALGAFATDGEKQELLPRIDVHAVDSTGAGDAFNGAFVTALSEGADLFEALRFGNAAGALSVTRHGTAPAMPTRAEIDLMMRTCGYQEVSLAFVQRKGRILFKKYDKSLQKKS